MRPPQQKPVMPSLAVFPLPEAFAQATVESRGAHSRPSDFPDRDDENFMKHSITTWVDGAPQLSYREVRVTRWEPMVRSY